MERELAARPSRATPPLVVTETALRQTRAGARFFGSEAERLGDGATAAAQAMDEHAEWMERELLPRADGDWRLGAERFAEKLVHDLDAGVTAAEAYDMARTEQARVTSEMYVVARQLWHSVVPGEALP